MITVVFLLMFFIAGVSAQDNYTPAACTHYASATGDNTGSGGSVVANYYVSLSGSDSNNGSAGAPFLTLQKAHDTAVAGNVISIAAGYYYQRVQITKNNLRWIGQGQGVTTIEGTDALTGWSDQGSGMFRVAQPGYAPGGLNALSSTANLSVLRWQDSFMNGSYTSCGVTGLQAMQTSANFTCGGTLYWEGLEAAWGNTGGFVYMRFRQGENPNTMSIRVGPQGITNAGTFTLNGADNNIIENMTIVGGTYAVYLRNAANGNIIRNNHLRNGVQQVFMESGDDNQFLNNIFRVMWIGANPGYTNNYVTEGSWNHPTLGDFRLFQYNHDKFEAADGGEHTGCIAIRDADRTVIDSNDMRGGTVPIHIEGGSDHQIRNNYLANCSAECVFWFSGSPLTMNNNTLYDGAHLIRIQRMEDSGKTAWFYRNHFHQDWFGKHVHFSFIVRVPSTNDFTWYHNTFTGEGWAADCGCGDSGTIASMANVKYVNNVLTGPNMGISSFGLNSNPGTTGFIGMWAYNHVSNGDTVPGGTNYSNNTSGGANPMWSNPLTDVLLPPSGNAALNSAIRLDQNWTIGTTRPALPGMVGGYYPDPTPHRGAWQIDQGHFEYTLLDTGTGSGPPACSFTQPCLVSGFWQQPSLPGKTLCLFDGTYTGVDSMIEPPLGVKGTSGQPITIRALNDGQVLLDAEHTKLAISLQWNGGGVNDNEWFVIDGVNARNGLNAVYEVFGSNNILRRVIGWDATSGQGNGFIYRFDSYGSRIVDGAGWGLNSRAIVEGTEFFDDLLTMGLKRFWGEWNDHPQGLFQTTRTLTVGDGSGNELYENVLGTWDNVGQDSTSVEGVLRAFIRRDGTGPYAANGTRILGSVLYVRDGATYAADRVATAEYISGLYMEDVVARVNAAQTTVAPFHFSGGCTGGCASNTCQNCLSINAGTASVNAAGSGFTLPSFKEGNGLTAATGGVSAFTLLPGICKRYESGVLTTTPLWPWPMNLRVRRARVTSGRSAVDITGEITSILGTIPSTCLAAVDRANIGGRFIPSSEVVFGPIEVQSTRGKGTASVEAAGHTNTAVNLVLTMEVSLDDGGSWRFVASTTRKGGAVLDDQGNPQPNVYLTARLPTQSGGTKRLLRTRVNLASGSFVSNGGFIEASN